MDSVAGFVVIVVTVICAIFVVFSLVRFSWFAGVLLAVVLVGCFVGSSAFAFGLVFDFCCGLCI